MKDRPGVTGRSYFGDTEHERREPHRASTTKQQFLRKLKQEYLLDLLRARGHSRHFCQTRVRIISVRIQMIALLSAVMIPAWIVVDAFYLGGDTFVTVAALRIATSVACIGLGLWRRGQHRLRTARVKLALLVLIPSVFQISLHLYFQAVGYPGLPPGYHFFPFMIITLGAIFPLTIMEGGVLAVTVTGLHMLTASLRGTFMTHQLFEDIWMLALLALISGWAALAQLNMLLMLYRQAHRDSLTGLANRRSIVAYLEEEKINSQARHAPMSVMLFDLDKFKQVNDRYGHAAGDQVLRQFSDLLVRLSRSEDLVGRYGGEEFLMVLSDTPLERAEKIAWRICEACRALNIRIPGDETISITTSIGLAQHKEDEDISFTLKRADEALYRAKGDGRNRVVSDCTAERRVGPGQVRIAGDVS